MRRRTTYSLALILACAAVWTSPTALTAAAVPHIAVTVRVYQTAGLAFTMEQQALAEAEAVLRAGECCHHDTSATLGAALVVRREGGVLATVYVDCVASLATAAGADVAVLLGRVSAHELGHLMMRTSAHARRGLMRPHWTSNEIRRNRPPDWAFTEGDVAAMRQPGARYWKTSR